MTFQISLEILRTLFIAILLYNVTLNKIRVKSDTSNNGWMLIQIGISFVLFGSLLDITDNFEMFNRFVILGKTKYSAFFISLFGYLPGIALTSIGFSRWIPKVRQVENKRSELEIDNVKIKELKQQLDTILRSIGDAVIAVDSNKNIIHMNPEAQRITGWDEDEAIGKSLKVVYKSESEIALDNDNLIDSLLSDYAIENENQNINIEDKSGKMHLISSKVTPMLEGDELGGMVIIFREMESIETVQKRLTQKKKMESLSIFANGVAHDFNNQLTGVQGFCELLESEVTDDEQLEYISEIRKAVDRSVELTDRLLAFARKEEAKSDRLDIADLITSLVKSYGDIPNKIKTSVPKEDFFVEGNKSRLVAAFKDIIDNSIDAIDQNGKIEISLLKEVLDEEFLKNYPYAIPMGEYVRCIIKDNGVGMNQETLEKIYEPFYTTSKRSYGKGMGLASVYGTISRHDGLIIVNSEFGEGTEVNVYLPLYLNENIEDSESNNKDKQNILIVDDEEFIRFYIKKELERRGINSKVFEDGESALKYVERHPEEFGIAIIDCVMPKMSGIDLMDKLKELNSNLGIVLMSGKVLDKKLEARIEECKSCEFLSKPFDGSVLMNRLKNYI